MANYHRIDTCNVTDGPGCRAVIWFSGCPFHCKGCFSPQTWHPKSGQLYDKQAREEMIKALEEPYCAGLTLLGGEPLAPYNIAEAYDLAVEAKKLGKTVWCYTGNTYEHIQDLDIMKYIDVLVDGPFIISKFNSNLKWRGSANQRVIDIQSSLAAGTVVLHPDCNTVDEFYPEKAYDPCAGMTPEEIKAKYLDIYE